MKGEADNSRFVSMHVYMHLAFKELLNINRFPCNTETYAPAKPPKRLQGMRLLSDLHKCDH